MLTVERKPGTSVLIGDDVSVQVRWIRNMRAVRLAIKAPKHMKIVREELVDRSVPAKGPDDSRQDFNVALVEDDAVHAELIREAFAAAGVTHVTTFADGEAARDGLPRLADRQGEKPNLVLLDFMLPDSCGLDLLREIRSMPGFAALPIVMMSSHTDPESVSHCLEAGAHAYVAKDARYEDLKDSVARIAGFWAHSRRIA